MTLKGLAALRQKVAPSEAPSEATEVREKPVPSRSQVERVERIKAAVDAVLPFGAEAYVEYGRLYIGSPYWEIVVDPDCKVAVLTSHTRKANSQGLTDAQVVEAAKAYSRAMVECEMVLEVVVRAKGAE